MVLIPVIFWIVVSMFVFGTIEKITHNSFTASFSSKLITSILYVAIQSVASLIAIFFVSNSNSALVNIGIVLVTVIFSLIAPYLVFVFGDRCLPKFKVVNHRFLVRCSFVYLVYSLLGVVLIGAFNFIGLFVFYFAMQRARLAADGHWIYGTWFYG
jgi:hypothetical protein